MAKSSSFVGGNFEAYCCIFRFARVNNAVGLLISGANRGIGSTGAVAGAWSARRNILDILAGK